VRGPDDEEGGTGARAARLGPAGRDRLDGVR
jgi:hypothetical protein